MASDKIIVSEITTENDLTYKFYPITSGSVHFQVKCANNAYIGLCQKPSKEGCVSVVLGARDNTKSFIKIEKGNVNKAPIEVETPGIVSQDEFRSFWVRWAKGIITVGREGERCLILKWEDPNPFPIAYIGIGTAFGSSGIWKIEGFTKDIYTPDQLVYTFKPVLVGSVTFEFRGSNGCDVALTPGPAPAEVMYEVILGGRNNNKSAIRHCRQNPDKVEVETPGIMHPNHFRKFMIEWKNGRVTVRDGQGIVIMEWVDPVPFTITHFGVQTGCGASGQWRITHFKE